MLKNKVMALAIGLASLVGTANAQEKYSKVKVYLPSLEAKKEIVQLLQLDHFKTEGSYLICDIGERELHSLKRSRFQHEVLIGDLARHLIEQNKLFDLRQKSKKAPAAGRMAYDAPGKTVADMIKKPAAFNTNGTMGGYYTYAEMIAVMDNLVATYPSLVSKYSIGKTYENRDIWGVKISDNTSADESEPEVLFTGLQHAREAITGTSLIFFMQYLTENYATDSRIRELVDNREIFIIPCVNVDGYEYNRTIEPLGGGMWRKNRNGSGVDINRNYGVDWGIAPGGSSTTSSETYWGTGPFSEPESQAVRNFVTGRNFTVAIDQHCYGEYYSLPYGMPTRHTTVATNALSTDDKNFYSYIPALMGKYNCHRAGNSVETVGYEVAGGIKDWLLIGDVGMGTKGKIFGMTGEAGGGGFWAPRAEIISLCQGLTFQNLQLAYAAGSYVELQDLSDVAIDAAAKTGSFSFSIRRVGVGDGPVTVTMLPIENIQSVGTPVTFSSIPGYFSMVQNSINYTLPTTISPAQRVRFAWKVEAGGITILDTITKVYAPVVSLEDNMEGGTTKWSIATSTGGGGAGGGKGGGGGGGTKGNAWNFTSEYAYEGTYSLTESPGADYDYGESLTVDYTGTVDLSDATAAYLSFWTRYRSENCNDKLQIQVSSDNGSTYTVVSGKNTIAENDGALAGKPALTGIRETWTRELIDLSGFVGRNQVKFRFVFSANGSSGDSYFKQVDDGFYIDNVKLVKATAILVPLPVTFVSFQGKLLQDNTVQLWWEAIADAEHDYFEVERSADGMSFTTLGKSNRLPPYQFKDLSPRLGNNYYRLKQVDKNGKYSYSKIINIVLRHNVGVVLYPNPVQDVLTIRLSSQKPENVYVRITDMLGKDVYRETASALSQAEIKINVKDWRPQFYLVNVYDSKMQILTTQKIYKY